MLCRCAFNSKSFAAASSSQLTVKSVLCFRTTRCGRCVGGRRAVVVETCFETASYSQNKLTVDRPASIKLHQNESIKFNAFSSAISSRFVGEYRHVFRSGRRSKRMNVDMVLVTVIGLIQKGRVVRGYYKVT